MINGFRSGLCSSNDASRLATPSSSYESLYVLWLKPGSGGNHSSINCWVREPVISSSYWMVVDIGLRSPQDILARLVVPLGRFAKQTELALITNHLVPSRTDWHFLVPPIRIIVDIIHHLDIFVQIMTMW